MRWSNCIWFAVQLHARREAAGREGYLVWRWSRWQRVRWIRFPHCLYGEIRRGRMRLVSYKPDRPARQFLPPPLFRGSVRWGDPQPKESHGPH
ncbi:MAG: hypothetical protein PGN26_14540 [Xylophilus ampelinus]